MGTSAVHHTATGPGLTEADRKHRRIRELLALLEALCRAGTLRACVDALERLARWLVATDRAVPVPGAGAAGIPAEHRRLAAALAVLDAMPELRAQVAAQLATIVGEAGGVVLLAEAGLPNDRGLSHETAERLFRRILPSPRDEQDLGKLLLRLFPSPRELAWIETMPPDLFQRLAEVAAPPGQAGMAPLVTAAEEALVLLAARVQALGLAHEMRARSRPVRLPDSPFFRLPRAVDAFLAGEGGPPARVAAERAFHEAVAGCRQELQVILDRLEATGVSVDVVYSVEVIEQALPRMEHLLATVGAAAGPERAVAVHRLLAVLVRARIADRSLRNLLRSNLHLLARKIIERAGKTGEHYITYTRREYWAMFASAMGGGALTTGTAALKVIISAQKFPLFVEGFLAGVNYAGSFILMQVLGLTLATKQPSMTAAQLAGALREGTGSMDELVTHVARICRSQLAAAAGNVSTVAVCAVGLDVVWRWRTGQHFLSVEKADYVLASLHPLHSGTVPYAMLTGVILWLSSLAAGWFENFAVYHRLPQAIAEHRVGRFLGERPLRWLSEAFARNISGWGGSLALGFMLGMVPVFGKFFGLPLDVRHVTLSTGTLALAAIAKGAQSLREAPLLWAALGIATIFVFNLTISFNLALAVALRAREVPTRDRFKLLGALLRRFLRHPGQFLLPPGRGEHAPAGRAH